MSILSRLLHKKEYRKDEFVEPEEIKKINNVIKGHPSQYPQAIAEDEHDSK